jgi:hypothetical protein
MSDQSKPLVWLHGEVKTPPFSQEARIEAGVLLRQLQEGETFGLPHSRLCQISELAVMSYGFETLIEIGELFIESMRMQF